VWLLHIATLHPWSSFVKDRGCCPSAVKGLSIPPLRCGMDKPLTAFTPIVKQAIIGLSPKAHSCYFPFAEYLAVPFAEHLAVRGTTSPGSTPQADFPWVAHLFGGIRQWDFVKPCPAIAGHPKGLGLGKISQVDYTPNEPAGENPGSSSRTPCFIGNMSRIASQRLSQ
jgi:hypothetical protein